MHACAARTLAAGERLAVALLVDERQRRRLGRAAPGAAALPRCARLTPPTSAAAASWRWCCRREARGLLGAIGIGDSSRRRQHIAGSQQPSGTLVQEQNECNIVVQR